MTTIFYDDVVRFVFVETKTKTKTKTMGTITSSLSFRVRTSSVARIDAVSYGYVCDVRRGLNNDDDADDHNDEDDYYITVAETKAMEMIEY